jgi:lipopolysaccharide transport system permease protein
MSAGLATKETLESPHSPAGAQAEEPGAGHELANTIEWGDSLLAHCRELMRHLELLQLVTLRELKVRYKQTTLGALWAVLQPFSLMVVFALFFSHFAGMRGDTGMPYAVFSYTGLLAWTFFSTALSFAVPSLISNAQIITKIYFPREIIPLSSVFAALFDFLVASGIYVGLLAFYKIAPTWNVLYVLPLLLIQIVFTMGICLLLSAFTVLYRDFRFAMPLIIQIWMFATPILYSASSIRQKGEGFYTAYMALNPMAVVIDGYRRAVVQGQPPEFKFMGVAAAIAVFLLWAGYKYFKHLERQFADIV